MNSSSTSPTPTTSTRKRTHLKSSQVAILQESFNSNPLPDSSVRSRLARELAVTERTIQIWFQNRRAKARKADTLGPYPTPQSSTSTTTKPGWTDPNVRHPTTPPRYQATFRTMMTPERFEELKHQDNSHIRRRPRSSSKPEPKSSHLLEAIKNSSNNNRAMSEGLSHRNKALFPANSGHVVASSTPTPTSSLGQIQTTETPIQMVPLPVSVLRIGSWTRFAHASPHTNQKDWDLVCYGSPIDRELIWRVQAEGHHFRIQVAFDHIHQLRLSQQVQIETGEIVGQLDIETSLPLVFSMWRFGQDHQWVRCGDFTEDKQASIDTVHILQGNHDAFKQSLLDLIALAPELASKISVTPTNMLVSSVDLNQPPPPPLDLCRDFTMSPSATPEPSSLIAAAAAAAAANAAAMSGAQNSMYHGGLPYGMINPQQLSKTNMSHLMLQAPFFYPSPNSGNSDHSNNNNNNQQEMYQMQQMMMQQQQQQNAQQQYQQQQQMMYMNSNHASSSNSTPSSFLL